MNTQAKSFDIEIDMLIKACKNNMIIKEMPSREKSRVFGESKLSTIKGIAFIFQVILGK